jgi:hypothetical protein
LRPGAAGKIGSTPIGVLVLIALLLIVVRSTSLVLEEEGPEDKRQKRGKEIQMNAKLIAGSALETAWTITAGIAAGSLPPPP